MVVSGEDCLLNQSFHLENNHIRSICRFFSRNQTWLFQKFTIEVSEFFQQNSMARLGQTPRRCESPTCPLLPAHGWPSVESMTPGDPPGEFCLVKWWFYV